MIDKRELLKLRRSLRRGAIKKIYDNLKAKGFEHGYYDVISVLHGRYYKEDVITEAFKVSKQEKDERMQTLKKFKQSMRSI